MWVVSYEKKTGLPIGKRGKNNDKKSRGACTCTSHEAMIETSCFFPLFSGTEKNENLWALGESRSLKERRLIFFLPPFSVGNMVSKKRRWASSKLRQHL